jgi:hypothetical protein
MDYEQQVHRASGGDVKAFVDLTRQFQHMAFGTALALVNDFHQAEDMSGERSSLVPSRGRRRRSEGMRGMADRESSISNGSLRFSWCQLDQSLGSGSTLKTAL